jgi:hypothetical protein
MVANVTMTIVVAMITFDGKVEHEEPFSSSSALDVDDVIVVVVVVVVVSTTSQSPNS